MNKKDLLKSFKAQNQIKRTILNFKSLQQQKEDLILNLMESNHLNKEFVESNLKETPKTFEFFNLVILKGADKQTETLNKLPFDIKTTSIKEYGQNWFKTDFALYELGGY
jgi:hypothetical protein